MSSIVTRIRSTLFSILRRGFRVAPMRESTRDALRQRFFERFPWIIPRHSGIHTPAVGVERRPRVHAGGRAIGYVERRDVPLPHPLPATLVAFYLPQYHVIPENNSWWGKGFTEWRNVARALPQFEGHAQPRLPGDLGFYDLSNPQVMRDQANLARNYGIGAFCFYFYWFGGRTLLESPLLQWLHDRSITLPFCLCWANENWTRNWDGRSDQILIAQTYSADDDLAFIAHIATYLRDPRYLRVDGQPLLLVYRPGLLPDAAATAGRWRAWCREHGIGEIHIAYVQSFERPDPREIGFDAAVEFPPNLCEPASLAGQQRFLNPDYSGRILDWRQMADDLQTKTLPPYRLYRGVNPGWDNEPRRPGMGRTYLHASPRRYRDWLAHAIHDLAEREHSQRLVFINAWNEWAEGAVLEPDARLGYAWLDASRDALMPKHSTRSEELPHVVVHAWYPEILDEILSALTRAEFDFQLVVTTVPENECAVSELLSKRNMHACVEIYENRGRDILPFLHVAERLAREGVETVLKLHTKRSLHRRDGDLWRKDLIDGLLGAERVADAVHAFSRQPRLGMIVPQGHLIAVRDHMGGNHDWMQYLNARLGISGLRDEDVFAAGSMYWLKLEALRPLLEAHLDIEDFEVEKGQRDGTLSHAIERVIGCVVRAGGYKILEFDDLAGSQSRDFVRRDQYRYSE